MTYDWPVTGSTKKGGESGVVGGKVAFFLSANSITKHVVIVVRNHLII